MPVYVDAVDWPANRGCNGMLKAPNLRDSFGLALL